MSPLQLARFYAKSPIDLKGDQVLETISKLGPGSPLVGEVVTTCHMSNISSPATTYKKLDELETLGLIGSRTPNDARCRQVFITEQGRKRLQAWGKA